MKPVTNRCPECGLELTDDSPLGGCPRCLLQTGLPESQPQTGDSTHIDVVSTSPGTTMDSTAAQNQPGNGESETRFFGDYELLEELATGGMGTVFRARQTRLNRVVALKMIRDVHLASETDIQRFYTEAESAANLDHPGIISVFEVGEQDGQHYFSMPLFEHGNLADWIGDRHSTASRKGLSHKDQELAAKILAQVAHAVHFAHQRQILHRDLKPSNILLDEDGQSVVTDFGLAHRTTADSRLTMSGTLIGTPSYMAPEQTVGGRAALTTSTDVYGLGAILYEMLTGRPPFKGETPLDTVMQVMNNNLQKPSVYCSVDPDLETICLKCLEKEPAQRYGSAESLAEELERWQKQEPIHARRAGVKERLVKWARRRPLVAGLATLLTAVTISAFLAISWQLRETELALELAHETAVAEATARAAVLGPRTILQHQGPVVSSTFSADGSRVLTASHDKSAVIWDARSGERIASLQGHSGVLSQAKFSNDGTMILTVSDDGTNHYSFVDPVGKKKTSWRAAEPGDNTVRVWNASDGQEIAVLVGHAAPVTDASFSPDGSRIISCSYDKTARVWETLTGKEILTLEGHKAAVLSSVFSPDGQHVLTSSFGTEFEVQTQPGGGRSSGSHTVNETELAIVWNAQTGQRLFGLKNYGTSSKTKAVYSPDGRWIATAAEDPKNVALWDARNGRYYAALKGHTHEVNRLRFSLDGSRLVTASSDATAQVFEVPDGTHVATMRGHDESVLDAHFTPDSRRIVTASGDHTARVWEASSGKGLAVLQGHEDRIHSATFSPDGFFVATASVDGTSAIWPSATLQQLAIKLAGHQNDVTSIEYSPDDQLVLTASRDGSARIWNASDGRELTTLQGHGSLDDAQLRDRLLRDVRSARFSTDGSLVVTATEETHARITPFLPGEARMLPFNPVRIFDSRTGAETTSIDGLECGAQFATFSPDGCLVVATPDSRVRRYEKTRTGMSSSGDRVKDTSVRIINVQTGEVVQTLQHHSGVVYMAAFSPNNLTLATVDEQNVRLYEVATGKLLATTADGFPRQIQIEFSPDGQQLLCRGWRPTAHLLTAADLSVAAELTGHEETLTDARFSKDGALISTASADGTARIWNSEDATVNHVLTGHRKRVLFAVFDPAGELLATSSQDRRVRLWDVKSGEQLAVLEGHKGQVVSASFSHDGQWLGTASEDYTARLWPVHFAVEE
jgi:eukaryotic-like serine/threonine-protein kinase